MSVNNYWRNYLSNYDAYQKFLDKTRSIKIMVVKLLKSKLRSGKFNMDHSNVCIQIAINFTMKC